ncbi:family S53 protease-like protein [Mycena floridula]|nr:family S53 protease-like protein [Mycena floridula]
MLSYTIFVSALAASVTASPAPRAFAVHETRDVLPKGYTAIGTPHANTIIDLRIALTPRDMPGLTQALYDVSTPGSSLYGEFLSLEELRLTRPLAVVVEWLTEYGIEATPSGAFNDWLSISIPVSKANSLLNADFKAFAHASSETTAIRTMEYSLPRDLLAHVELIHPTTSFAAPLNTRGPVFATPSVQERALTAPASCATTVTPACLQALYGIPSTPATQSTNTLGVSDFIDQWAQTADLKAFLTALRKDMSSSTTFTLQTLDGGVNTQSASQAGIEANLDIQYTIGVATAVPTYFISVGDSNTDGVSGFIDIIDFLNAETAPPQVLTTSYGFDEPDLGSTLATRIILFASGDGGVSGSQCRGCPFVTSVGATHGIAPEVTATFSSGGFSRFFARPDYQNASVPAYLTAIGTTNAGKFTATERGFPDIAAQGQAVEIVSGGITGTVSGTSCSSPIFASVIALINDQLIAAGKPTLGFLNPFIYANPGAFFDITSGNNPGCSTNGFSARAGWDPITGIGTPNFAALLTAVGL